MRWVLPAAISVVMTLGGCSTVKDLAQMGPADVTCDKFMSMNDSEQKTTLDAWRDRFEDRMSGNPMYVGLDSSGKRSLLMSAFSMYCSQDGHGSDKLSSLTWGF